MRHIKRNVYAEINVGAGGWAHTELVLAKKSVTIAIDRDEPFVGYCRINGKDYVVEVTQGGKWVINRELTEADRQGLIITESIRPMDWWGGAESPTVTKTRFRRV